MRVLSALALAVAQVDAQACVFTPGGTTCMCAGVDMSALMGKVYQAPKDAEGYAYSIAMCSEIPKASLPSGCQQYAEHPSVVKVRARSPVPLRSSLSACAVPAPASPGQPKSPRDG